ncbi:hypothetical protein ACKFR8_07645 [Corynebacterium axilliensis]|uniref:hypothetical protein n=1 Tax=Corynebacterium sp. YSMAA5_1_F9 TaxID=3383591 RepID=UPI0038CF53A5
MFCVVLDCGGQLSDGPGGPLAETEKRGMTVRHLRVSEIPTRQELKEPDAYAREILPEDPTPSLDDIAAQPNVRHLGKPAPAPQAQYLREPLRVIVAGSDAALSAVLTRIMRGDYLWAEVGFVPTTGASTAATNWGLPEDPAAAWALALDGAVKPVPLIRNDAGLAVAGSATIAEWTNEPITGEIIVDDAVLLRADRDRHTFGAKLVPMVEDPGILAAKAVSPVDGKTNASKRKRGLLSFLRTDPEPGQLDPDSVLTGRAVQAGGPQLRVSVDGESAKRPVTRVTFYRHLRDLQVVRP